MSVNNDNSNNSNNSPPQELPSPQSAPQPSSPVQQQQAVQPGQGGGGAAEAIRTTSEYVHFYPMPGREVVPMINPNMKHPTVVQMESIMESCPFKTGMAGVGGFFLGGVMGVVLVAMDPQGGMRSPDQDMSQIKFRDIVRDMRMRSYSMAKNFGVIGFMFAGNECIIESARGRSDEWNSVLAGCTTGGMMGFRAGAQAGLMGCAGFAAFSYAIDRFMDS